MDDKSGIQLFNLFWLKPISFYFDMPPDLSGGISKSGGTSKSGGKTIIINGNEN